MRDERHRSDGRDLVPVIPAAEDADDPAAAFAALQAAVENLAADLGREMATIRKGVEAAFDRFEGQGAPVDYGADLGRLIQQLAVVGERLQAVEQAPVLRQGAEHYAQALARSGEGLVREAVRGLERQAGDLERIGRQLAGHVAGARTRRVQERWLAGAAIGALILGVVLTLFTPRMLPVSVGLFVASTVLGADHWTAGAALMQSGSAPGWKAILAAHGLEQANREVLAGCREVAAKAGREQRCTVSVPVPAK